MRYLWLAGIIFLTGCAPFMPSDKTMESLMQSERSWCVSVTSVYGTIRMGGTGVQGGKMSCLQEGLTVEDMASRVGVPILLTPSFSIGAPTTK